MHVIASGRLESSLEQGRDLGADTQVHVLTCCCSRPPLAAAELGRYASANQVNE